MISKNLVLLHTSMKKTKNKYYVVWDGHQAGIYDSWDACKKQVDGYTAAKYKAFESLDEATKAFGSNAWSYLGKTIKTSVNNELRKTHGEPLKQAICVDAACSGNPGVLEYRGVNMITGQEIFRRGPFPQGTNNIGEFLGIVTGLAWLKQNNLSLPLYSDSQNAILWIKAKRVNTKLVKTEKNKELFELLDRALEWLHANRYDTRVLKWETKAWGEIPADFGRK